MFGSTPGCSAAFGGVLVVPGVVSVSRSPASPSPSSSSIPSRVGLGPLGGRPRGFQATIILGKYKEKMRYKKCSLVFRVSSKPSFSFGSKTTDQKSPFEGDFSFLFTNLLFFGATSSHTVLRSPKVVLAGRANREAPRERRNVFSVVSPFSFFFFFFVVGNSFLEQREREREREDILCARKRWCWRLW